MLPRFSSKSLMDRLNSYIPAHILNFDLNFMPPDFKKIFETVLQTQPIIKFGDFLEQSDEVESFPNFYTINKTMQNQLKSIKFEHAVHFHYQWILKILKCRITHLLKHNILDDLQENSQNYALFESQFLYLDLTLNLLIQMNLVIQQGTATTQLHRIMIYDTFQMVTQHFIGFVKKFSKFLLAPPKQGFRQINDFKLAGESFSLWLIKYFEELTKLLQQNERLNTIELERILPYVYVFLTIELLIFAHLSQNENLGHSPTLEITIELIQEPLKRLQCLFFLSHKHLDELCKIETQYNKPFIWNYLLALTIFKHSEMFPTLALDLYDNFEQELDRSNGHFYHLFYQWLYFLFFTEISAKIEVDRETKDEIHNTINTHLGSLQVKQRYVLEFLQNSNKEFLKVIRKLIKKTIRLGDQEEYAYLEKWLSSIKELIFNNNQPHLINLYWSTYQKAILSLRSGDANHQNKLNQLVQAAIPQILKNFLQVGQACGFNLEKSPPQMDSVQQFNTNLLFFTRYPISQQHQLEYLDMLGRFLKESINYILKNESITETLLNQSCVEQTSSLFFCLVAIILEVFEREQTNRYLILSFLMKVINKVRASIASSVTSIFMSYDQDNQFNVLAQDILFKLKLVAFICRTYSILCVNLRQKNKILHTHQGSTREPLFKVVQNAFNFMSLNDSYGHFYENQQGQKLQTILLQNKIYMESLLEFTLEACQQVDRLSWPDQYDARSFVLMLAKEIVNLQYVTYFNEETLLYYDENNAMRIHQLTYKMLINTLYLIKDRAHTIDFKDQMFHLLNQLMNLSVGRDFYFQIEQYLFYDENQYVSKIEKDIRKKLSRFLEQHTEEIQIFFLLPKVFELILSLLFEAPSDTEHKFYVLSLLNLILAQSIQATLQIHQILPKFILHMRLESNPQILKMMSSCIQKIMFIKSDITSFKALFQAMGHLPAVLLKPYCENKAINTQVLRIEEVLQSPDYLIPLFNEEQRRALSEIIENEANYRQILSMMILIIKNVIQNNFGRQNQFFFTGQQSGIHLKSQLQLRKHAKNGLGFQLVFQLKFEKMLFGSTNFKSQARSVFASNVFASTATLFQPSASIRQMIFQMANEKVNVDIYIQEEKEVMSLIITVSREQSSATTYNFNMRMKRDYKNWLFIQVAYSRREKGFTAYVNNVPLKLTTPVPDLDLTSVLPVIAELNLGQESKAFQKSLSDSDDFLRGDDMMNRSSSVVSQMSLMQYMQDEKFSEIGGLLDDSNLSRHFVEAPVLPKMNFSGQMQMFYFLNGINEIEQPFVYQLYSKCKGQSKQFDDEIDKQLKECVLVKLNLNLFENQNVANYKQFLNPNFITDYSRQPSSSSNPNDQYLIVNPFQRAQEAETINVFQNFFGKEVSKKQDNRNSWQFMIEQRAVFYLDSYSIYDILIQFGQHELFYFVILLIFRMEQSEAQHSSLNEENFKQTLLIMDNIIEHFKDQQIVSQAVEESYSKTYKMITFIIQFYLKRCRNCNEGSTDILKLSQSKGFCVQQLYKKHLDFNKQVKEQIGMKLGDTTVNPDMQMNLWKSLFRKMTSQIGLWYFLNEDLMNLRIYISNLILKDEEFNSDQSVQIHQSKFKINKLEDKMRRKFYLKIDKKWWDKPYSLNSSEQSSTTQRNQVEDSGEATSPGSKTPALNRLNSLDSISRLSGHRPSVFNLGPSFFQAPSSPHITQSPNQLSQDSSNSIPQMDAKVPTTAFTAQQVDASTILEKTTTLEENQEKTIVNQRFEAELITPKGGYYGFLIVTERSLLFESCRDKPDNKKDLLFGCIPEMMILNVQKKKSWTYPQIREIQDRRFLLQEIGIEIFTRNDKSFFINLFKSEHRQGFYKLIESFHPKSIILTQNRKEVFKKKQLTDRWLKGEISNFHYLMLLNSYSGRSFNDINQYFVFPWVINEYENEEIKLKSLSIYRDLGLPVGALNQERFKQFKERYETRDEHDEESNMIYGTHYSHSTIILSYLMRLEPYAFLHHQLQGGKFDIPDRLFHSLSSLWQTSLQSDVKELIPEFFFMPDFLQNKNHLNLGNKQNADKVDDVDLPRWVKTRTPEEFIFIMRHSLENSYVSKNLHKWINLIFGYQNQGNEALAADNLFHYITYEKNARNLLKQQSTLTQLKSRIAQITFYGQTPFQLFEQPHPHRTDCKISEQL